MSLLQDVFLVRHGRTAWNVQDRLRGRADPPLDPIGRAQAEAAADALAGRDVNVVWTGPSARAVETAKIIAARFGAETIIENGFAARDYGPWTGHDRAELVARFGAVGAAPGVETVGTLMGRVWPAVYTALGRDDAGDVVIVSHAPVIENLIAAIAPDLHVTVGTGSCSHLRLLDGIWGVVSAENQPPVRTPPHP